MSPALANLLLLSAGAIWGMGFVVQQTAMQSIGPMTFVGFRFLLAGLAVLPFAIREYQRHGAGYSAEIGRGMLTVSVVFFLAISLQQIGLLETTVTNAGFLTALYVIMVPFILFLFVRQRQPIIIWPASILALAGIFLLGQGGVVGLTRGDWLVIVSSFFVSLHVIYTERVGRKTGLPLCMAACQFLFCGVLGLLFHYLSFATPFPETAMTIDALAAASAEIFYAGIFSGCIAFTIQAVAQRHTSASMAAIMLSSESLFAALLAAILIGDRLSYYGYVGCLMIFIAILAVQLYPQKEKPVIV